MCQDFLTRFPACGHRISSGLRSCATGPCPVFTSQDLELENLLEFCPGCFLLEDPRSVLRDDSPFKGYCGGDNIDRNRDWAHFAARGGFWFVRDVYIRAGLFNATTPRNEDISLFAAAPVPKLDKKRRDILSELIQILAWDFWERLIDGTNPPTRDQKVLILQLQKAREAAEIDHLLSEQVDTPAESAASQDFLRYRDLSGMMKTIEKEGTPAWILKMLGAAEEGELKRSIRAEIEFQSLMYTLHDVVGHDTFARLTRDL